MAHAFTVQISAEGLARILSEEGVELDPDDEVVGAAWDLGTNMLEIRVRVAHPNERPRSTVADGAPARNVKIIGRDG